MLLDKKRLAKNFGRAAKHYEQNALLQKRVLEQLIEQLEYFSIEPKRILDLGSGTGQSASSLARKYPKADIIQLDLAKQMLAQAKKRQKIFSKKQKFICADAQAIPLVDLSVDLVFSNLAIQWVSDQPSLYDEIKRVLRGHGLFVFSSLGPETLNELRQSWYSFDESPHVNVFRDIQEHGDKLILSGFADPVLSRDLLTLNYETCLSLLKDLKTIGVSNVDTRRRKTLTAKSQLKKLEAAYELYRRDDRLPASYEVIYGHAWVRKAAKKTSEDFNVPLADIPFRR